MTLVTTHYLEMRDPTELRPKRCPDARFQVREATTPQWRLNRFLYSWVGAEWQWTDNLSWSEQAWRDYAEDPGLRTFVATYDGSIAGYFELRERDNDVEILYFGLTPDFIGKGLGGPLLTCAIEAAWTDSPKRVWVHTCDLDHAAARANYEARGMRVYKTEEEDT